LCLFVHKDDPFFPEKFWFLRLSSGFDDYCLLLYFDSGPDAMDFHKKANIRFFVDRFVISTNL